MVFALLAEQNIDMIEEVETLKKHLKGSLIEFAGKMEACFLALGQDITESSKVNQTAISEMAVKIDAFAHNSDKKTPEQTEKDIQKETRDKKKIVNTNTENVKETFKEEEVKETRSRKCQDK